jgi:hypothetical protein
MDTLRRVLNWFVRAGSLAGAHRPTRVSMVCRVVDAPVVRSAMSGREAPLIHWSFFLRPTLGAGTLWTPRTGNVVEQLVGSGLLVDALVLECAEGTIDVPSTNLRVFCAGSTSGGERVTRELPDELAHIAARAESARGRAELYYRELSRQIGDVVRLIGTVAPGGAGAGAYRRAGGADYVVRSDLEPALLVAQEPSRIG